MLVCQIQTSCTFSHPILFINFAYTFVSTSIQRTIFPSRHTTSTGLFWLILLSRYMALSNVLPPSNQVTRSLRQTTQETLLPAETLRRPGKVSPHVISNLSSIDHISQMHHPEPFDLLGSLNCPFMRSSTNSFFVTGIDSPLILIRCAGLISARNPKSRVYYLVPTRCAQIQHRPLHR